MQLLNSTGMGTPMDYMYQNQYYGGAGYNPAPQYSYGTYPQGYYPNMPQQTYDQNQMYQQSMYNPYYGQQMYNQYGYGTETPNIGNIQNATVIGNKAYNDDTIPSGIANSPSMAKQFEYYKDPNYQNYGNNNSYYQSYSTANQSVFSNFGNRYNPYAYYNEGYYNPYLSKPLMENMAKDYYSRNPNAQSPFTTGYSAQNGFFRAAEMQREAQIQYENQYATHRILCDLNSRWFNMDPEETVEARQKHYEEVEKRQKEFIEYQNEVKQYCFLNSFFEKFNTQEPYEAPSRRRYIEHWNNLYTERTSRYPENYTMYQFFNEGIAENMYMDTIIDLAKMRDRELNQLYDRNAFRQSMSFIHPGFNPNKDPASYASARLPLTLDDMEITLPESLKNTEEFKRKEKFISSIIGNMTV